MARAGVCVLLAAVAGFAFWLLPGVSFVQAPQRQIEPAVVAGAAVVASVPLGADAFVYKGHVPKREWA